MIDIIKVNERSIELRGVHFKDGEVIEQIMDICHKYKHLYKDGYPCGRKTRKKDGKRVKRWTDYPGICYTYLITNDTKEHNLLIKILVSSLDALKKKYTNTEIEHFTSMYIQDVTDEILGLDV